MLRLVHGSATRWWPSPIHGTSLISHENASLNLQKNILTWCKNGCYAETRTNVSGGRGRRCPKWSPNVTDYSKVIKEHISVLQVYNKAMRNWFYVSGPLASWNWCTRTTNTKLIFNTVHFDCLCIVDVCLKFVLRIFKILKDRWVMHCVCLQAGRPKWVRAQDPKHRINYARPTFYHQIHYLEKNLYENCFLPSKLSPVKRIENTMYCIWAEV
jgi:hypothetical protein